MRNPIQCEDAFKAWLVAQHGENSRCVGDIISRCRRLNEDMGELTQEYAFDCCQGLFTELDAAQTNGGPAPRNLFVDVDLDTAEGVEGMRNVLADLKKALRAYCVYRAETDNQRPVQKSALVAAVCKSWTGTICAEMGLVEAGFRNSQWTTGPFDRVWLVVNEGTDAVLVACAERAQRIVGVRVGIHDSHGNLCVSVTPVGGTPDMESCCRQFLEQEPLESIVASIRTYVERICHQQIEGMVLTPLADCPLGVRYRAVRFVFTNIYRRVDLLTLDVPAGTLLRRHLEDWEAEHPTSG